MCILVVEDESLIRLIMVEELTDLGYDVCEADSGDIAADIINEHSCAVSMLVTDIHMPGSLDGFAVASLVREHYPDAPIIFTTGRPDVAHGFANLRDNDALLSKPFLPSELIAMIGRLLRPDPVESGLAS